MVQSVKKISTNIAQPDELWRHIFDTEQAGIIISINAVIQEINRTALDMIGARTKADVIGLPFFETILFPEYIQPAKERELSLRSGKSSLPPMEIRIKRRDGGSIDALISATSWIRDTDTIIESMIIDITPLKQRERLHEAISKLMEIAVSEELSTNTALAVRHALDAMHALYAIQHNCGYISFNRRESPFFAASSPIRSSSSELLLSYEPLEEKTKAWLCTRAKAISRCEPCAGKFYRIPFESGDHQEVLLAPFFYQDQLEGSFFWIFPHTMALKSLRDDDARRQAFILAASTAMTNFMMRLDNQHKSSDLAILHRAAIEIGKMGNLQQIANTALDILLKEKSWAPSVIRFKSRTSGVLETVAYRGLTGIPQRENEQRIRQLNRIINRSGKGMIGAVIATGYPIRSLDLPADPRYVETYPGIRYGIYAPIVIEERTEGAVGVESASYAFTESDLQLLSSIGEIVAMAVKSVRLIEVLRERVSWLEVLHNVNQQIGIETKPEELYQILVDKAVEATGAEAAAMLIFNPSNSLLELRASSGWLNRVFQEPMGSTEGISGKIFTTGATHLSSFLRRDPLLAARNRHLVPPGKANIGVPVIAEGTIIGVFHITLKAPVSFNREFIELVEIFGSYAGIIIGRMQRIDALRNTERQLQTAYDETLEGWARAIGIRDDETLMHTERVAKIAEALGRSFGLGARELENLHRGALLHDVGKIGIPDYILLKPGALNEEERNIMQTHASFGYELLKPIKYLEEALVVPYCHHERWDGAGYPRQLKGDEIPFLARIFAIADVYDAMTSNRPYRAARTSQEALEYIRSQSGKHFDPRVVEAFLSIIDSIEC